MFAARKPASRILGTGVVAILVAIVAGIAPGLAKADPFGSLGQCERAIGFLPGTTIGQLPGIAIQGTVVQSAPNTNDPQTVHRYLYLYRWTGSTWVYVQNGFNSSETYVQPFHGTVSTWFLDSGTFGTDGLPFLSIPFYGMYYGVTQQLVWTSNRTGQTLQTASSSLSVVDFDNTVKGYCSFVKPYVTF